MPEIGRINTLTVVKQAEIGLYLDGENLGRLLLPRRAAPNQCLVGDRIEVFVHYDQEGRLIATTKRPAALPGGFAYIRATGSSSAGALLDWGLPHPLLAPTAGQRQKMVIGKSYLVRIVHQENQRRIIATSMIDSFLDQTPPDYQVNQPVEMLIGAHTELGYKAIINDSHWGVLYENEVFQPLKKGDRIAGFIKKVREDYKIDLCLQLPGYEKVDGLAEQIVNRLKQHDGFLAASDKTPADLIHQWFGVSKKNFKKAIGRLYKQKRITLAEDGIRLNPTPP